jgi:hypothetical protein
MLRLAGKEDFVEDLYLAIRELVEHHQCQPREIRRFANQALKGIPPKSSPIASTSLRTNPGARSE